METTNAILFGHRLEAFCLQGDCSEEHVCLPLFCFRSKEDADKLEIIADEVLGTEEEGPPSRWDHRLTALYIALLNTRLTQLQKMLSNDCIS